MRVTMHALNEDYLTVDEAATLLGIGRNTLTRKVQELKIDTKD